MKRVTDLPLLQAQFFERLALKDMPVAEILREMRVPPFEYVRWRKSIRFRARMARFLRAQREVVWLDAARERDFVARRSVGKPGKSPPRAKGKRRRVEPGAAVPHLPPAERAQALARMRFIQTDGG